MNVAGEKMISNLSRFVVIVWIFVVLVLQSSYIASLTSMLTVQQLQPDFTDIHDLLRGGDHVGYNDGSFVAQMLKDMGFKDSNLKSYNSLVEYNEALSNGSVSAIFDELPYVNAFVAKYCTKYMMVGPTYKTAGFGFVSLLFPYLFYRNKCHTHIKLTQIFVISAGIAIRVSPSTTCFKSSLRGQREDTK